MNILLVRLSSFGDILFTTPVIDAIHRAHPGAQVDVVTYQRFAGALEHHPGVRRLLRLPKKSLGQAFKSCRVGAFTRGFSRFASELRAERYDLAVDLHNVTDSSLVARLARAAHRVGNRRQTLSTGFRTRCGFDDRNETAHEHAAVSNLRYLVDAGVLDEQSLTEPPRLSFYTPQDARQNVDRYLAENDLAGRQLVGLNPGGSYEYKRWPPERFAEVGAYLQQQLGSPVLLFGGPAEREVVSRVAAGIPGPVVDTSALPMFDAFELISRLRLFVTNDSAPLHIAAAARVPAVGLYGPANFEKFYPLSDLIEPVLVDVPCRPCTPKQGRACRHRDCFGRMTVQRVCGICDVVLEKSFKKLAS
ncbi:MAG: glycosyltransferase family 9 protein [Planctomycetales bacterium]|nr:glycosyltransferase family 9 protein [Planctomycetales bacterium]